MERVFNRKNKIILLMIVALCIICITPISYGAKKAIKVNKISLYDAKTEIFKGQKFTVKAVISPVNATNKKVKWTSSDKKVATINSDGIINPKKVGRTTITATAKDGSGVSKSFTLNVKEDKTKVQIIGDHVMYVGEYQFLTLNYGYVPASNYKWKSSKPSVATVDQRGFINAKKAGKTIITVKSKYGPSETSFTLCVNRNY